MHKPSQNWSGVQYPLKQTFLVVDQKIYFFSNSRTVWPFISLRLFEFYRQFTMMKHIIFQTGADNFEIEDKMCQFWLGVQVSP